MKKINSLAKILFFFFAILSFSLVIVSCNDDDEEDIKTTTSTTEEEDDEDLDSIPIEEMTLEQLRKVFIGSWEGGWEFVYCRTFEDTLTFYKNGSVEQIWGYFNGSSFELLENSYIQFNNLQTDRISNTRYKYKLSRDENNIYTVEFKCFDYITDDLMIHNVTYKKIQ